MQFERTVDHAVLHGCTATNQQFSFFTVDGSFGDGQTVAFQRSRQFSPVKMDAIARPINLQTMPCNIPGQPRCPQGSCPMDIS